VNLTGSRKDKNKDTIENFATMFVNRRRYGSNGKWQIG
jgi:hypothetical protein